MIVVNRWKHNDIWSFVGVLLILVLLASITLTKIINDTKSNNVTKNDETYIEAVNDITFARMALETAVLKIVTN